ncbi:hypothetical protein PRIC1_005920 [Phytophthora ramorum]|uniref:uncharacterized protein n=1 Tax=Phytophthora ramorum TaxID=164328 RepID=UPI0030A4B415|nr:hypothetical protein KRP23_13868 [Phytophthora ramorum]
MQVSSMKEVPVKERKVPAEPELARQHSPPSLAPTRQEQKNNTPTVPLSSGITKESSTMKQYSTAMNGQSSNLSTKQEQRSNNNRETDKLQRRYPTTMSERMTPTNVRVSNLG